MTAAPNIRPNPLDQALRYLSLGFSIIPLKARDKRPALHSWKEYQRVKATESELREWFSKPDLNIGIVTGAVSGIVVIDADDDSADTYVAQHYPSPVRSKTAHGRHYIYAHPGHEVRNGAKLKGRALDIRADGGYIVAPGSVHPDGSIYVEEGDWCSDLADCPVFQASWLGDKVVPLVNPQEAMDRQLQNFIAAIPGVGQGKRDAEAYRVACKLIRDKGLAEQQALDLLRSWNQKCTPPLADEDLKRKIASALKYGRNPTGWDAQRSKRPAWQPEQGVDAGGEANLQDLLTTNPKTGEIKKTPGNLAKILRMDAQWGDRLSRNEMTLDVIYDGRVVDDAFTDYVQEWIEDHYRIAFGREDVTSKLVAQANNQIIHPVREMLLSLPEWDGVERIRKIGPDILHNHEPLTVQYMVRFLVGAVRRVLQPGCKMDSSIVMVGEQGIFKSTFWKVVAGAEFFGDSAVDLESKDGAMVIHRSWITELGEIDHVTSNKVQERVKAFTSQSHDIFRPPFGKCVQVFPRSCVLVGTTNRDGFLTDPTGSRRYWPVKITRPIDIEKLAEQRDQILAEALYMEAAGVEHWLPQEFEKMRQDAASSFEADEPWEAQSQDAIETLCRSGRPTADGFTLNEILNGMGISISQQTRGAAMKMAEIMKLKGWHLEQRKVDGKKIRLWKPNV